MAGGMIRKVIVPYIGRVQDFLSPAPLFMAESSGPVLRLDPAAARPELSFLYILFFYISFSTPFDGREDRLSVIDNP